MITRSGLIELLSGWTIGVAAVSRGQIRMELLYDPNHELPAHGVKDLRLTADEASEVLSALEAALAAAKGD